MVSEISFRALPSADFGPRFCICRPQSRVIPIPYISHEGRRMNCSELGLEGLGNGIITVSREALWMWNVLF